MAGKPFSNEEINFLKFAAIVFDEFPKALRQAFITMWDNKFGVLPGYQLWDDSATVRNMLLVAEGVKTDIPINLSINRWDCTALFKATIYAKIFAIPGSNRTLAESYIKGRKPKPSPFHSTMISPSRNQDETLALAIDQLRLLRNTLCHSAGRKLDKLSFDHYVNLAKYAFAALGVGTTSIDVIGSLTESDFPTKKVDELNESIQKGLLASNKFLQEEVIDKFVDLEDLGNQLIETVGEVKDLAKTAPMLYEEMKIMNSQLVQARETENQTSLPQSRLPPMVHNFVGRETECEKIITSLTSESTRHVNIYGSPGFGKTSTATSIGHRLQSKGQLVYFFTFRGLNSKNEFISKLLSFFKRSMTSHLTPADELCSFLQGISCRFFLILDNLDDILACSRSYDNAAATSVRDDVLKIIEEILMHCRNVRILTTTRESLQFIDLNMGGNESLRIEPLDAKSSLTLVNQFLPSVEKQLSLQITKICGYVPLAIKLLCALICDDNQTPEECLKDFLTSSGSIADKLDNPSHLINLRLKLLFESSFNCLSLKEREAFVSLSVFNGADFEFDEAVFVVSGDRFQAKQTLRSLDKRALINYNSKNKVYSLHPLLQSFAVEKGESELNEVVLLSKRRFYEYYINLFEILNEQFLTGEATITALVKFNQKKKCICLCLYEGVKDEKLCSKLFNVLVKADFFLHFLCPGKKSESLYDLAINEAKQRENNVALYTLLVSKCFFQTHYINADGILVANSKKSEEKIFSLHGSTNAKYRCYQGIHALSNGRAEPGIQLLEKAFPALSDDADQIILKIVSLQLLRVYYQFVNNLEKSTQFLEVLLKECRMFGNVGPFLVNLLTNEIAVKGKPCESTVSQHQPLIIFVIKLLSFWGRDYLSTHIKANLRKTLEEMRRQVEIALPSWDDALASIFVAHDLAMAYLCGEDETKNDMEDTVKNIEIDLEKVRSVCQNNGQDSESKRCEKFLMERLAGCFFSIGRQYESKKQPSLAAKMYQLELDVLLELHGELHAKTATCHRDIGLQKEDLKDYNAAMKSQQRALDIRLHLHGENHNVTSESFNDIGRVQREMGDYTSALQSFQRALDIRLQLCGGEEQEDTARTYTNIATLQNKMGAHISALQTHQRELGIRSKYSDDEHKMAISYTDIAIVQECTGDYPSALRSLERSRNIFSKLYGEQHRETAKSLRNIAIQHGKMGNYSLALQTQQRALDLNLELFGEHDSSTAKSFFHIGVVQFNMQDYTSALESFERSLQIRLKLHGEQHEDVAESCYSIGIVLNKIRNYTLALKSFQRAHNLRLKLYGKQHPKTTSAYERIQEVERKL